MKRSTWVVGFFAVVVLALTSITALAEDSTTTQRIVPEISAYRVNPHPPVIDGNLSDEIWKQPGVEFARNFTQRDPDDGAMESESTVVAVVYDDDAIYVAFWCYDSEPDQIHRQLVRRDRSSESDYVIVRLDPYHDHQTGNQFYVTAAGVLRDGRVYNDDWTDNSWDAVWEGAAQIHPWGWGAEFRIPYHCVRFTEAENHTWGVNFARWINRKSEATWWSYASPNEKGLTSHYGHLKNLTNIKPARHLEVLPYAVSSAEIAPKTAGNSDGREALGNMGLDVKYGLTSNLTLDATFNPDFGQVELDRPVLNLSAFETWFSERRPFFMEGADLYNTNFTLFYSRRIGRAPTQGVDDDEYAHSIDRPDATSILGAAKLTGKLGSGTSIGVVTALTQEEKENYAVIGGGTREAVVEPLAGYTVARVKQDIFGNSAIGGMLTMASQDGYYPATTGGFDWRLQTPGGEWEFNGQTVFSRVDNEDIGFGFTGSLRKAAGKHWRGSVGTTIKDPNFNLNRLGFSSRNDEQEAWTWIQYRTSDDWWIVRNSWNNVNYWRSWNYDGADISNGGNLNTYIEFTNYWSLGGGVTIQAEKYSDVETRGNGLWEWPVTPTFSWWANLETDRRKKVSFSYNPGSGADRGGNWFANYIGMSYRPRSNMEFEIGGNYHRTFGATRWVANDGDNAIFADLDQDQVFLQLTASVMLHRNLSWQISGQGLISTLQYRDYKRYAGNNTYVRDVEPLEGRDGTFSSLNSTMLVRWEYLPGSTLYFVWTRSRPEFDNEVANLVLRDELDRFFSHGASNVWLMKLSYWWNL